MTIPSGLALLLTGGGADVDKVLFAGCGTSIDGGSFVGRIITPYVTTSANPTDFKAATGIEVPAPTEGITAGALNRATKRMVVTGFSETGVTTLSQFGNGLALIGSVGVQPYRGAHYSAASISPDGSMMIPGTNHSNNTPGTIYNWNGSIYAAGQTLADPDSVNPADDMLPAGAFNAASNRLYAGGEPRAILPSGLSAMRVWKKVLGVWEITQNDSPVPSGHGGAITDVALAPGESSVVTLDRGGVAISYLVTAGGDELSSGAVLPGDIGGAEQGGSRDDGAGGVGMGNLWGQQRLAFTPDGANLIACKTRRLQVWARSGTTYTFVSTISTGFLNNQCIDVSPDGTMLAVCGFVSPFIRIYSISGTGAGLTLADITSIAPAPVRSVAWVQFGVI